MNYHISTLPYSLQKGHPSKFDNNGVLLSKIPYTNDFHYHLTSIASHVIATGDESNLKWIIDNLDNGIYRHKFAFPFYPMEKNWIGGLAQGLATSALMLNNEETLARKVCKAIEEHCMYNSIIYEYPSVEILNGHIYALFALHDAKEDKLFKNSCDVLLSRLKLYDMKYWSLYDQYTKYPATEFYHKVHVQQLEELYKLTDNIQFHTYAERWKSYITDFNVARVSVKKHIMIVKNNGIRGTITKYRKRKEWLKT